MNKTRISVISAIVFSIFISILLLTHKGGTPVTTPSMGVFKLLGLHWIGVLKFLSAFVAGGILLFQGFFGNILKTVKSSVVLIGLGIWGIAFGYGYEFFVRVFIVHRELLVPLIPASVLYLIGGILVAVALFAFPKSLDIALRDSQRMWFVLSLLAALIITIVIFFINKSENLTTLNLIIQIIYPTLTLLVFASALRCTMVFAGGRIGRPFLLISIGSLTMFLFNYIVWARLFGNMGEFGVIHILFVFSFLITTIGAVDLTLTDDQSL
ncbi:MAG: hypothetical protein R2883_08610 [Caldisericia bacterium]